MINSQNLINKICSKIDCGGLTDLETCQTTGALNILSTNIVVSVTTKNNLPDPFEYAGRMIYVDDENRYYHAVDGYWLSKLNSEVFNADVVWAWGSNSFGRLGDDTTTDRSSPVPVVGGFTDWCQVSAGGSHSLGVRTNGTAWAWGYNGNGRLGLGDTTNRSSTVSVIGGFTDWCQVSAGSAHSLGVRTNGTAWTWGLNSLGRLGLGDTTDRSSPVSVIGGFTDWCAVAVGTCHSLAVRTNGTAWAWGNNGNGRLGDGTTTNTSSPVSVVGGFTDWCQVSGSCHSLAIRQQCKGF
jgi:alpha-tubulin suppressor-like RCC1 family protein